MDTHKSNTTRILLKTVGTVGGWTLVSRVLGFIRDILLARMLGAGILADAFFVAFKLPNFFRRLLAEGTLAVALIPVLTEERKHGEEAAHTFLNALAGLLLAILLIITLAGMLFMPALLLMFAPGFHDEPNRWSVTVELARWMFPYLALISLTAMAWAVLNNHRRFAVAAASPALLNIALIFAALFIAPDMENPALALAWGVLLGGVLQLAIQFPALRRIGWIPRPTLAFFIPPVRRTLKLFGPALAGVAAVQINMLAGTILATFLPVGAVSYLYYSDRIVQLPLALFGIAMGTALLPALSEHFSAQQKDVAIDHLKQGLTWLTWIILPAMTGLLLLAHPIIVTLFQHGHFTAAASDATAQALQAYTLGLMAFCWARVLATACYADQDSKTPMYYAAVSVCANIVLAVVWMQYITYLGLALATSCASWINAGLLLRYLHKKHGRIFDRRSFARMLRATLACLPMLAFILITQHLWPFPDTDGKLAQCAWLILVICASITIFFATARLSGERLYRRFAKNK